MSAGYGRGYYGSGQLEEKRRRSWFTIVAVIGAGAAVVWLLWPRRTAVNPGFGAEKIPDFPSQYPQSMSLPPIVVNVNTSSPNMTGTNSTNGTTSMTYHPTSATGAFLKQLEDDARARGFISVKDYEDSVVASAKQLQASGAQVMFAPHLQHLAAQLGS